MPNNSAVRRILPQDVSGALSTHMASCPFVPHQYPQRETQKNYVFVDEHNRHKRLKVMRACEGCRRRKIKCDAATTNTWPCSACIRLKLLCVRPNGQDGSADFISTAPTSVAHETAVNPLLGHLQHFSMHPHVHKAAADVFAAYPDPDPSAFVSIPFESQHNLHYTTMPPSVVSIAVDQPYTPQNAFPTPPIPQAPLGDDSSEADSPDSNQQQDLADLLGTLKVDELGTAPYLRNKASFRQEQPAIEDDDHFGGVLLPIASGPGHKIRIPPELIPDDASVLHYFDLYFDRVHPYVPVLDKSQFYHQWNTDRDSISPLILEALFAIGGRLAEDPAQGQQWLALASRHADSFMDIPRLSTLQALLMILKAREAAPKRGYYYRSWMAVVQCVQMGKDLGLDEHYDDHRAGRACESTPEECQLRTRIWQTIFVCEVMVGTPQGRHDLSVDLDTVDFGVSTQIAGGDDDEYLVSRNFSYFARLIRNIGRMSNVYARIKRKKDWGMDPEFQQLSQSINSFPDELPPDMTVYFPPDSSPPWLRSSFMGNLHSYYYLTLILYHRPVLSFLDPSTNEPLWKHHMLVCYNAARALCRLQEAILQTDGLNGLQAMQRGFSFTVYAGLSCIVLHLVAIVSPDPELNSDAREYFTRHMRIMEKVMEAWPMPELQKQIDAVREAFSADVSRPFVLKPSFPYGSPRSSKHSSPPQATPRHPSATEPTRILDQPLDTPQTQPVGYSGQPISPPTSTGAVDNKIVSSHSKAQPLVLMSQDDAAAMTIPSSNSTWNPTRIFEQWNTSFGSPAHAAESLPSVHGPSPELASLQAVPGMSAALTGSAGSQSMAAQPYATTPMTSFITPAMWQESVASVYEGGLKRGWDYDTTQVMKR